MKADYTIYFDGGAKGNPGNGYGSFLVMDSDRHVTHKETITFDGVITSNAAEYRTLLAALDYFVESLKVRGGTPADFRLSIIGDSMLVIKQVGGEWSVKSDKLAVYCNEVKRLLAQFKEATICWQPRGLTVMILGH